MGPKARGIISKGDAMNEQRDEKAIKRLMQARTYLLLTQPFFGALALRLLFREDRTQETMWTNGREVGYSPDFVNSLTKAELCGVLCHEVLHCSNGHPWRRGQRDPRRWNEACDYAIDPLITGLPGIELPDIGDGTRGHIDAKRAGKSAEQIYTDVPPMPKGKCKGKCRGDFGEVRDGAQGSQGAEEMGDWKIATAQAARVAKACGSLPGQFEGLIQGLFKPQVDWRSALWKFVQQAVKSDYSYKMPNRRFIPFGLYLPALLSQETGPIVWATDTSGSVSDHLLKRFYSERQEVVRACNPSQVVDIQADTRVTSYVVFEQGEALPVEIHVKGRGGTDFRPVFDRVAKEGLEPVCLVYLTDLDGPFPGDPPDYPVLFVTQSEGKAPWGETIKIAEGGEES